MKIKKNTILIAICSASSHLTSIQIQIRDLWNKNVTSNVVEKSEKKMENIIMGLFEKTWVLPERATGACPWKKSTHSFNNKGQQRHQPGGRWQSKLEAPAIIPEEK